MNGAASSGVGGMINLEPKHAGETPQAKVGVDYTSDSQIGTTLDAGRRFGDNDQFGARVNLVHREGKPAYRMTAAAPRCSPPARLQRRSLPHLAGSGLSEENLPRQPDQRQHLGGGLRA